MKYSLDQMSEMADRAIASHRGDGLAEPLQQACKTIETLELDTFGKAIEVGRNIAENEALSDELRAKGETLAALGSKLQTKREECQTQLLEELAALDAKELVEANAPVGDGRSRADMDKIEDDQGLPRTPEVAPEDVGPPEENFADGREDPDADRPVVPEDG